MSAKYYGDPIDDIEFKRLVNKRETKRANKARKRGWVQSTRKNIQNKRMGDEEPETTEKMVGTESEGDGAGGMLGDQADEEGASQPRDHMVFRSSGSRQLPIMSDDRLTKLLEQQTATKPNSFSFSEIKTQTFTIKSNGSYLHDQLIGRSPSESPLKRKSEASIQSQTTEHYNIDTEVTPTKLLSNMPTRLNPDTPMGHRNDLQIRIKVEESPTPASLLKRIPQYLEPNDNHMASLEDYEHGLVHFVEVTYAKKRKSDELDSGNAGSKYPKTAEETENIGDVRVELNSHHEPAESNQIKEFGNRIDLLVKGKQLSPRETAQKQNTGRKQGVAYRFFLQHVANNHDQFLSKVCPLLEHYVREGMRDTLILPKPRLEADGRFDELVAADRSDQLAVMCLP